MAHYPAIPEVTPNNLVACVKALKEAYEISQGYFATGDSHRSYDDVADDLASPTDHTVINVGETGTVYFGDSTAAGTWRVRRESPPTEAGGDAGLMVSRKYGGFWVPALYVISRWHPKDTVNSATAYPYMVATPSGMYGSFEFQHGGATGSTIEFAKFRVRPGWGTGDLWFGSTGLAHTNATDGFACSTNILSNNSAAANTIGIRWDSTNKRVEIRNRLRDGYTTIVANLYYPTGN